MANKVEIIVVAKDETKPTFDKLKAEAEKAGKGAGKSMGDGVDKGLADMKKKIETNGIAPISALIAAQQRYEKASAKAGEAVKKFGEDSKEAADAHLTLARASIAVEGATKKAAAAFGEMSPALHGALKDAGLFEGEIGKIGEALKSGVKKIGADAGQDLGKGIMSNMSSALGDTGPLLPVVVGAMAGIAPFAGAALAAGVIGAAGTGGLVGGILLAAQDPAIMKAFGDLGTFISSTLRIKADVFKQPLLDELPSIRSAFQTVGDDIGTIFAKSSTWVKPLIDSVLSAVQSITGGLASLVSNGDGVMSGLFDGIKQTGAAIGDMFNIISENGPAAATALTAAFALIDGAIEGTGQAIGFLTKTFGFLSDIGAFGPGLQAVFEGYNQQAQDATTITAGVGKAFEDATGSIQTTKEALKDLSDTVKAQSDPMFALMKAQEDVKKKQDDWNEAVRKHGANSEAAQVADEKLGAAAVDLMGKAGDAAGTFNGKLSPALIDTLKAANVSQAAIDALGRQAASSQKQLDGMAKTYTVRVTTIFDQIGKPTTYTALPSNTYKGLRTGGTVGAAASGGIQGNMTLVGEDGPELVSLPYGSSVKTAGATRQMISDEQKASVSDDMMSGASSMMMEKILNELRQINQNSSRGGDVYLDNRKVGSVQGRQANLYERAG